MPELIYKNEVYRIIGACMKVYNALGYGFLEIVYKDAMEIEFQANGIPCSREYELPIFYNHEKLKRTFYADFIAFDNIIIEVKTSGSDIKEEDYAQTINYLKASGRRLGVLINFGKRGLEYKRVVF